MENSSGAVHLTSISLDISELQKQVDLVGKEMDELAQKATAAGDKVKNAFSASNQGNSVSAVSGSKVTANVQVPDTVAIKSSVAAIESLNLAYKNFLATLSGSKLNDNALKQIPLDARNAAEEMLALTNQVQNSRQVTAEQSQKYYELSSRLKDLKGQFADVKTEVNNEARQFQEMNKTISESISALRTLEKAATFKNAKDQAAALRAEYQQLADNIKSGNISFQEAQSALAGLGTRFDDLTTHVNTSDSALTNFVNKISESAKWQVANILINSVRQAFGQLTDTIIQTEQATIELRRVLGEKAPSNEAMSDELYDIAYEFGQTFEAVQEAAVKFAQTGMGWQETIDATRATMLALNTAELDTSQATEGLIAVMAQFHIQAEDLEEVIDKINITADHFPVTSEKIVAALQRAGGTASAFNMSLEETIAIITALSEATGRAGSNIGTALNSLISFSMKSESLAKFSEFLEKDVSDYGVLELWQELAEAIHGNGEELSKFMSQSEEFSDLMDETLASSLGLEEEYNLALNEQNQLLKDGKDIYSTVGTYRQNYFIALLGNIETAQKALENMQDAAGYSAQENEIAMETFTAKWNQMIASLKTLAVEFGNSGFLDMMKLFTELATILVKVTGAFGGLNTILGITATLMFQIKGTQLWEWFKKLGVVTAVSSSFKSFNATLKETGSIMKATGALGSGLVTNIAGLLTNPLAAFTAGATAVYAVYNIYQSIKNKISEARQEQIKLGEEAAESLGNLYDVYKKFEKASSQDERKEAAKELLSTIGLEGDELAKLFDENGNLAVSEQELNDIVKERLEMRYQEYRLQQQQAKIAAEKEARSKVNTPSYDPDLLFGGADAGSYERVKANIKKEQDNAAEIQQEIDALEERNQLLDDALASIEYYNEVQEEIANRDIDPNKTIFGNIDLNNRQVLEWTEDAISTYDNALKSWGETAAEDLLGSISTVFGAWDEFDDIPIAFSPMLQTENGAVLLDADTVYDYIWGLIEKAGDKWDKEDLLKLDTDGLEINGIKVKNLLADVGETAEKTAESMHYLGTDGAINESFRDISSVSERLGVSIEELSRDYNALLAEYNQNDAALEESKKKFDELGTSVDNATYSLEQYSRIGSTEDSKKNLAETTKLIAEYEKIGATGSPIYEYLKNAQKAAEEYLKAAGAEVDALALESESWEEYADARAKASEQAEEAAGTLAGANETLSISFEDLEKRMEEAGKKIDTLNGKIDSFQSSYSTLQGIIKEYNETGQLTADMLQTLMSMEPEYLEMLSFEGEQMSINEGKVQDLMTTNSDYLVQMAAIKIAKQTDTMVTQLQQMATEDLSEAEIEARLKTIALQGSVEKAAYAFLTGKDDGRQLQKAIADVGTAAGLTANEIGALTNSVGGFSNQVKSFLTASRLSSIDKVGGYTKSDWYSHLLHGSISKSEYDKAMKEFDKLASGNTSNEFWFGSGTTGKSSGGTSKTKLDTLDDKAKAAMTSLKEMLAVYEHSIFLIDKNDWGAEKSVAIYREMQAKVHEQADKFREMGFGEDSEYIRELQKLHWGYHDDIIDLYEGMYDDIIGEHENMVDELQYQYDQLEKAQDFSGMTDNLQKQVSEQKAIQEAALKEYEQLLKVGVDKNDDAVQSCLKTIRDAADEIESINEKIKDQVLGAYDDFISAADKFDLWDSLDFTKVNYLQQKMNALNKLFKEGTITLQEYNSQLREMTEAMYDAQVEQFEKQIKETEEYYDKLIDQRKEDIERLKKQKDATKDYYDTIIDGYKEEITQWNKREEEVTEYYDNLIDALNQVQKDNDRINRQIDYYNSRQKIITNLEQAQARSGVEWREKEMEYQQQLIDLDQEWNRTRQEWSIEDQIAELNSLKDAALADIDATIEQINASIDSVEKQSEEAINNIENEIKGIEDVIDDLEKQSEEAIDRIEERIKELSQQIAQAFSSATMNGMLNTAQSINSAFSNAGNMLFGGNVMSGNAFNTATSGFANSFLNSAKTASEQALKTITNSFINPALPLFGTLGTALGTALTNGAAMGAKNATSSALGSVSSTLGKTMLSSLNNVMKTATGPVSSNIQSVMSKHTQAANAAGGSVKTSTGNPIIYVTNNVNSVDTAADKTNALIQNLGL